MGNQGAQVRTPANIYYCAFILQNYSLLALQSLLPSYFQHMQGPDGEKGDKGMKGQMGESGRNGTTLSGGASTYVNWGVNNCPNGNEVYTGRAVSPKFNNAGGGAQYLCLPDSPMNDDVTVSDAAATSTLVGVHFETYANPSPDFPNSDPTDMDLEPLSDHDGEPVLCAVCQSMDSAVVMIPNNLECPDTGIWSMEYTGYLMAARDFIFIGDLDLQHTPVFGNPDAHFRTEYICVNNNPSGGGSNAVPADPTTEAKLAHTRIYCTSVTGFDEAACLPYTMDPTDQIELCTDINGVVHCSFGPLGCVVCTASQAPIATP